MDCVLPAAEEDTRPSFTQQQAQFMEAKGIMLSGTPLYLDMQATTPMDPRVLDRMLPFMTEQYGNPHSRTHYYGWESEDAVEVARKQASLSPVLCFCALQAFQHGGKQEHSQEACPEQVAKLVGADPKEIVFTSGATEANNMAIKGIAGFYKDKRHVITTQTDREYSSCTPAACSCQLTGTIVPALRQKP